MTPYDGKQYGKSFETEGVRVINTPPLVRSIRIEPFPPFKDSRIRADVDAYDPDGDPLSLTYRWFVNGREIFGEYGPELHYKGLKKGDKIRVEVSVSDGEAEERSFSSKEITIANSPPRIVSDPPAFLTKDNTYIYQVKAYDPDNDPLTYELLEGPPGMRIDPNTGIIKWRVTEKDVGEVRVEISANDGDGGKGLQRFILRVGKGSPSK